MTLFDELKTKFGPPLAVKPYGLTIVIQGSEFDPDWEVQLGDQGYACHFGKLDKHPVVFVPLKKAVAPGKVVYVPPAVSKTIQDNGKVNEMEKVVDDETPKSNKRGRANWTESEDNFLVALWKQMPPLTVTEISDACTAKFPHRTFHAVTCRITTLQEKGLITPKQKHKHKSEKSAEAPSPEVVSVDEAPVKVDVTDVLVHLVHSVELLSERYDALNNAYVELKADLISQTGFIGKNLSERIAELRKTVVEHKHAVSGEAMLPMEAVA